MNAKKYRWIFYLITATILTTIAVQFYWNYKNYQENKQRVINEIQISLDNAIEKYYTDLSKEDILTFVASESITEDDTLKKQRVWRDFLEPLTTLKRSEFLMSGNDSISFKATAYDLNINDHHDLKKIDSIFKRTGSTMRAGFIDSLKGTQHITQFSMRHQKKGIRDLSPNHVSKLQIVSGRKAMDSLAVIKNLQTIYIAIQNDSINYKELDSILTKELKNKGINSIFYFKHKQQDSVLFTNILKSRGNFMMTEAKSTFLKPSENFELFYSNPTTEALKRSSTGILLSLLLSFIIISSLFYLLRIINQQKELAEIKNDLISNITHEFKTPIATVSTAIEAIENFNVLKDTKKTQKYLKMSSVQLEKLHQMVEKLLETATLDSENLLLKKEPANSIELVEKLAHKHQLLTSQKTIRFSSNTTSAMANIDVFHFENALSNLIDNAIKYGGNLIEINVTTVLNSLEITVADNGNGIEKNLQEKIFDKFYRIPRGNTHDVKGFGIGLYYCKKIIEKHQGTIQLLPNTKNTIFKITLPNDTSN